jgi:hypothetical protein
MPPHPLGMAPKMSEVRCWHFRRFLDYLGIDTINGVSEETFCRGPLRDLM